MVSSVLNLVVIELKDMEDNPGPGTKLKELEKERSVMKQYLQMKVNVEDWHGVQDAASDLRDIDNWIAGYTFPKN